MLIQSTQKQCNDTNNNPKNHSFDSTGFVSAMIFYLAFVLSVVQAKVFLGYIEYQTWLHRLTILT